MINIHYYYIICRREDLPWVFLCKRKESKRMCQKTTATDDAGLHDVTLSCASLKVHILLKWLVCVSLRGRENRSTTVEQLVSSDHHKLLCLYLTLMATLLYWGQQAETMLSTASAVTTGWGGKEKLWPATILICVQWWQTMLMAALQQSFPLY